MEKFLFDTINSLGQNCEKINELLDLENDILMKFLSRGEFVEKVKDGIQNIHGICEEMRQKRKAVEEIIRDMKESETVNQGILYSSRQRTFYSSVIENEIKELAAGSGAAIICFTVEDVNFEDGYVKGIVVRPGETRNCFTKIPTVIYNTVFYSRPHSVKTMKQLRNMQDIKVVNPVNCFNQSIIFDMLQANSELQKLVLPFSSLSASALEDFLSRYGIVFLVPEKGVYNRSSIIIEKAAGPEGNYTIRAGKNTRSCGFNEIYPAVKKMVQDRQYLVLKGIKALKWNGSPLEVRIYVQKGAEGKWGITKMIAKNEMFCSGLMFKDSCEDLIKVLLDILPSQISLVERLTHYSIRICSHLENYIRDLGSCTLDFICDENSEVYPVYFGGWEQKDFLLQLSGRDCWSKYMKNAFEYLLYLQNNTKR